MTEGINVWFRENIPAKNAYIAFASMLMDIMLLGYLCLFASKWKSFRVIIAYFLFFLVRSFL